MSRPKTVQATAPDWTLTAEQLAAVDLLARGKTVAETAQALDVESQTIRQWRTQHYGVQAALNAQRQEQWGEQIHRLCVLLPKALDVLEQELEGENRLRVLLPKALDVLEQELEGENRLQAAVHVLKACKLYGLPVIAGPTDVEDIAIAAQARMQERQTKALLAGIGNGRFA